MARRAFIGINRRVGSLKPPRVRGVGGGRSSEVSFAPTDPTLPPELELEVDEIAKVQKVNGLPVDIEVLDPIPAEPKGNEDISSEDKLVKLNKEEELKLETDDIDMFPGPSRIDIDDFSEELADIKTGLGVLGAGEAKEQKVLDSSLKAKKKKKTTPITRKKINVDVRKDLSKKNNAKNNIKAGLKPKTELTGAVAVINVINEQIEITRKTKKKSTPRPIQSMIQMVRPRPSVPVVEPRTTRTIAGQPITRQQTRTSTPIRTSRPTRTRSRGSY